MQATNPEENILIRPNDVISVPRADIVYVIGEVKKAGGFALSERSTYTGLQALAMADGMTPGAAPHKAMIIRQPPGGSRVEIPANLKEILNGKQRDVECCTDDILFIPTNVAKNAVIRTMHDRRPGSGVGDGLQRHLLSVSRRRRRCPRRRGNDSDSHPQVSAEPSRYLWSTSRSVKRRLESSAAGDARTAACFRARRLLRIRRPGRRRRRVESMAAVLEHPRRGTRSRSLAATVCGILLALVVSLFQTPVYFAGTTLEFQAQGSQQQPFEGISLNTLRSVSDADADAAAQKRHAAESDPPKNAAGSSSLWRLRPRRRVRAFLRTMPWASFARRWESRRQHRRGRKRSAYAVARLQITPVKDSRIVQITSESTVPQVAADYVNTVASEFIRQTVEDRWSLYQSTST